MPFRTLLATLAALALFFVLQAAAGYVLGLALLATGIVNGAELVAGEAHAYIAVSAAALSPFVRLAGRRGIFLGSALALALAACSAAWANRRVGPSAPLRTQYYRLSNEIAWEWRFCDGGSRLALFDVMFDASTGIVRTSYQRPDDSGRDISPRFCGH